MTEETHRLLARQVHKSYPDLLNTEKGGEFLSSVNRTYLQFERELKILEESAQHMLKKIGEANDNLHTIIESLDSFNYHVSHDLKNSMINVISLSKMLKKYLDANDFGKVGVISGKLEKTTENGLELVDNFLRISKFESKLVDTELEIVNIPEMVKQVITNLDLENKFELIFCELEFELISFKSLGMYSLLQNLITNAVKYKKTDVPLRVEISLRKEGEHKIISFKDNGIGMDLEKHKNKLFKPFSRIDNNLQQEGTGVGLFLVKKVVVEHFGSIDVFSNPDKGTEFCIRF